MKTTLTAAALKKKQQEQDVKKNEKLSKKVEEWGKITDEYILNTEDHIFNDGYITIKFDLDKNLGTWNEIDRTLVHFKIIDYYTKDDFKINLGLKIQEIDDRECNNMLKYKLSYY
jgi:hypothetical protein